MRKLTLALALSFTACATAPSPAVQPCRLSDATINATLWMQTAAEYEAITREVYGTAARTLDDALADKSWTAATEQTSVDASLPPAVILDLDETVLDTSGHQTTLIREGLGYSEEHWHEWVMHDASRGIEAAHDFLVAAQAKGVAIFYVTNRLQTEVEPLRATLTRIGVPLSSDNLLVRGARDEWKSSDKTPRRAFVASHYRVIMLFGDDLNDFANARGKSLPERESIVRAHAADWGRKWFVLPNPVYGSWENAVVGDAKGCDQLKKKIDTLR
jgi:acid phosphatase